MEKIRLTNNENPKKRNTFGYAAALLAAGLGGGAALNNAFGNQETYEEVSSSEARPITEADMRAETGVTESLVNEKGEVVIDLSKINTFNQILYMIIYDRDQEQEKQKRLPSDQHGYIFGAYDTLSENEREALFRPGTKSLQLIARLYGVSEVAAADLKEKFENDLYVYGEHIEMEGN